MLNLITLAMPHLGALKSVFVNPIVQRILVLTVVFFCGVGAHSYYTEYKRLAIAEKALEKGNLAVLEYVEQTGKARDESDKILEELKGKEDAPIAPVLQHYFDGLRKR